MDQEQKIDETKQHPLFPYFAEWCESDMEGSIDPNGHPKDWLIWWDCFLSGAIAQMHKDRGDSGRIDADLGIEITPEIMRMAKDASKLAKSMGVTFDDVVQGMSKRRRLDGEKD